MKAGAPIAAQADDPCQTPNVAPTFLPRDSRSTPQPTRTPLPYDPCAPTATHSFSTTVFASTPTPALPPVIPTPQLATNGLFGRYFTDTLFTKGGFDNFHATRLDPRLNFEWQQQPANPGIPGLGDCFSVRWTARLKTPLSGTYLFVVNHDDGVRLWVAGQLVVDKWQDNLFNTAHAGEIFLEANQAYPIRVELYQNCAGPAGIRLSWALPGQSTHTAIPSTQFLPELTPDTVAVYRPSDQTFYLRYHNTTGVSDEAILYGNPGDIPLVGDWNGDGLDEIGVYRPSTAQWFLRGRDGQTHSLAFGTVGDIPLVGKWNRLSNLTVNNKPYLSDGVGVFRPSTNTFYFRQTLSTGVADYSLSVVGDFAVQPSDVPVVGDWDGDGIETIGFYRPTNQRWSLSNTKPALGGSATFPTTISFGEAGGLPFTGDWLGRGSHLLGSLHAGFVEHETVGLAYTGWLDGGTQFFYGSTGDLPLAGKWIARCANGDLPLPSVGCTILQALPTNTRRPTRTPEPTGTPTLTPTLILTPTLTSTLLPPIANCTMTIRAGGVNLRRGPSTDDMRVNRDPNLVLGGEILNPLVRASDEEGYTWYGFEYTERINYYTWVRSDLVQLNQTACQSLLNDPVRDKSTLSDSNWTDQLSTVPPRSPIEPSQLLGITSRGFAIVDIAAYASIKGCKHNGFDFITTASAPVYAMWDGIVVGIGDNVNGTVPDSRPYTWGATNPGPFNVVIRTGGHFVLYGHLEQIEEKLFIGMRVNAGDHLGKVTFQNENTHLHVQISTFSSGQSISTSLRPRFGAIMSSSGENPDRVTDLMYYLPLTNRGNTSSNRSVSVTNCPSYNPNFPSFNYTTYSQAQLPAVSGTALFNYESRDNENLKCFSTSPSATDGNVFLPAQCITLKP